MKKMISDSGRAQSADLAEEFSLSVYFWGLAKRRKWGGRMAVPMLRLTAAQLGRRGFAHVFTDFEVMRGVRVAAVQKMSKSP